MPSLVSHISNMCIGTCVGKSVIGHYYPMDWVLKLPELSRNRSTGIFQYSFTVGSLRLRSVL